MVSKRSSIRKHQTGSALIIGLTVLLLMFILGTAGMRTTIMEEKMAGNVRDSNIAFQAAELGLQDGEQDLSNRDSITFRRVRSDDYKKVDFSSSCIHVSNRSLDGLCLPPTTTTNPPKWLAIDWNQTSSPLPYREYNQYTSQGTLPSASTITPPPDLAAVSRQPRYILEYLAEFGSVVVGRTPSPKTIYYRVTAQGYGIAVADGTPPQPLARIMLQSVYGR